MVLFPEPKKAVWAGTTTQPFKRFDVAVDSTVPKEVVDDLETIMASRFWDYPDVLTSNAEDSAFPLVLRGNLRVDETDRPDLFAEQGYHLEIHIDGVEVVASRRQGFVNALTTIKMLLSDRSGGLVLEQGIVDDYPAIPVRAVAPTLSWYAGYGRIGFDMQLWGLSEWKQFVDHCVDNKINQLNMVMYGYWPFSNEPYPETEFRDLPVRIWNAENQRFIDVRYSHPNIVDPFLRDLIDYAHTVGMAIFAYVGLNSYNGGWTIAHPDKRMKVPADTAFLNDFDSACLSDRENERYILSSMKRIAELGFDGFSLEESEEGFWFCTCPGCSERWGAVSSTPGEAKHKANVELLDKIRAEVRSVKPDIVIGIRAFRQPPLEKDRVWLEETSRSLPEDIVLFWTPALYVPPTEFNKWVDVFGPERIWGRDSESNSITSTMGRLFRVFESNVLRYEDEANVQVIERDIEQHISSVVAGVHGINGFMFEWYGLFLHLFAHGNYGWGSQMNKDEFFEAVTASVFGDELGPRILSLLRGILTIHESQIPQFRTPFPFQSNTVRETDIPTIRAALERQPVELAEISEICRELHGHRRLRAWEQHFRRIENAVRRNREIYLLCLTALEEQAAHSLEEKRRLLLEMLEYNEADFAIAREMFFDLLPVGWTGVRSCMMPYHELKREIENTLHPERRDDDVICSGIEALGWLWLANEEES